VDFLGDGLDEPAHDILVGQEVGTLDRVPGVELEGIALLGAEHRGRAPLGAHRVRPHQLDFRHDADVRALAKARTDLDGCSQAGQAGAENQDVVIEGLSHRTSRSTAGDSAR